MNCDWRKDVRLECFNRAEFVPPAMFGEVAWDCLLALYAEESRSLSLDQLAGLISVPAGSLQRSLAELESRHLVTGEFLGNGQVRALLTRGGRDVLETYLAATTNLQSLQGDRPRLASRDKSGAPPSRISPGKDDR